MPNNAVQEYFSRKFRRLLSGAPDGQPPWLAAVAAGDDPGLFLPTDAPWIVHRDFGTLVGGIRALLLQAMHPGALGGVAQHSRYEEDPLGRLSGTIRWLTVTTFGSLVAVENEATRVNRMHDRVRGKYENAQGKEIDYKASDQDLLLWVHIAFMDSFLRSHQLYSKAPIPGGADEYVRLWGKSVTPLGLSNVPKNEKELIAVMQEYSSLLHCDEKALSVIRWIKNAPLPKTAKPIYALLFQAALASLPKEIQDKIGLRHLPLWILRPLVTNLLAFLRFAIGPDSPIEEAALARLRRLGVISSIQ
ncbi:MAG: oxygenase MpaB family protein [Aquiluna sp.]